MKLQIVEPLHDGHHTNYLLALLNAVDALLRRGAIDAVVVTVTPEHRRVLEGRAEVAALRKRVAWDDSLPTTSSHPSFGARVALHRAIRATVDRLRPDALLCTTSDIDLLPNAVFNLLPSLKYWPERSAGIVHYGYPRGSLTPTEHAKRLVYEFAWSLSRWQKLLLVNPLVYEALGGSARGRNARRGFVPDPVPAMDRIDRTQARLELGLPVDATLVGCIGMMDHRRAVPELLRAFRLLAPGAGVRLVLAGRLDANYRRLIDSDYARDVEEGRLLVIDRPLTEREVLCGYAALDLHSMLQYRRFNLSANVLKCVAAGRPFVCDRIGHAALLAARFDAGVACDLGDADSVVEALRAGLAKARGAARPVRAERLVEFHAVENFARTALASVCGDAVYRTLGRPLEWHQGYGDRRRPEPAPARVPAPEPTVASPAWSGSQWGAL